MSFANDTNFEESYKENCRGENTCIKRNLSQLILASITDPQPDYSQLIQPNAL